MEYLMTLEERLNKEFEPDITVFEKGWLPPGFRAAACIRLGDMCVITTIDIDENLADTGWSWHIDDLREGKTDIYLDGSHSKEARKAWVPGEALILKCLVAPGRWFADEQMG